MHPLITIAIVFLVAVLWTGTILTTLSRKAPSITQPRATTKDIVESQRLNKRPSDMLGPAPPGKP